MYRHILAVYVYILSEFFKKIKPKEERKREIDVSIDVVESLILFLCVRVEQNNAKILQLTKRNSLDCIPLLVVVDNGCLQLLRGNEKEDGEREHVHLHSLPKHVSPSDQGGALP